MVVKNLEFFDKDGYNLNLNWNADRHIWEGNIFFPRVSVGLYENTTIYVVEKDTYSSDDTDGYTYYILARQRTLCKSSWLKRCPPVQRRRRSEWTAVCINP